MQIKFFFQYFSFQQQILNLQQLDDKTQSSYIITRRISHSLQKISLIFITA